MAWTVEKSRYIVRDEPWVAIREEACRTEDGTLIDPYYVLEYPDWANVVALTDEDGVVLVRQYRHAVGRSVLEIPSGAVDAADPSAEAAARRELREETGFEAERWEACGVLSANPATHTNSTHCFLATGCRRVAEPSPHAGERLESLVLPLAEALERAARGEMLQALHVGALHLALARLGRLRLGPSAG